MVLSISLLYNCFLPSLDGRDSMANVVGALYLKTRGPKFIYYPCPNCHRDFFLPAFLDTGQPRGNVHERDSGPVRGAIPTQSHNP